MARLFGTDGVRGIANQDLNCELVFRIGQAGARVLTSDGKKPRILIARDTRISGKMLYCALAAGITSVGADVIDLGVLPTPGVAHLVCEYRADAAVMISASHNSYEYNGIKWFNGEGFKLSDQLEDQIERLVRNEERSELPTGAHIGIIMQAHNALHDYTRHLLSAVRKPLDGLHIVLDCANGAASAVAPRLFQQLGMRVHTLANAPDGININAGCGSTHPERLQQEVVALGADAGFAFDGDADRLIGVDEKGALVDGDRMLAICGVDMKRRGVLQKNTVVGTQMTNLGMKLHMQKEGITVIPTDVGDRYVLERMRACGYNLGGEQSGHLIFLDCSSTGDGMLSAIQLLNVMADSQKSLSTLASRCEIFPQILLNVKVAPEKKEGWKQNIAIQNRMAAVEQQLGPTGRVLVRASGTEPLLRIMLEGENQAQIQSHAMDIAVCMIEELDGEICG